MEEGYFISVNILQYQNKNYPTMYNKRVTLGSIINSWVGEDVQLKVQGLRMVVVDNKQYKNKKLDSLVSHGVGLFSKMAQGNLYNNVRAQKQNYVNPSFYQSGHQYVVRAASRSPHRVSLADLGQIYNHNKNQQNRSNRKQRASQLCNESYKNNYNSRHNYGTGYKQTKYGYDSGQKQNANNHCFRNYQTVEPVYCQRKPLSQSKKQKFVPSTTNNIYHKYQPQSNNEEMEEIVQSINGIKLPANQSMCPQYEKANTKFENMKSEILQKILKTGEGNEIQEILKQIRQAADEIILRHKYALPKLQKNNAFSFNEQFELNNAQNVGGLKFELNKIEEVEDEKSQMINLPLFKDDAGSISSILSVNGLKKDDNDSKDQDFCKIDNVFIHDGNPIQDNQQQSSNSIKPIILPQIVKNNQSNEEEFKINLQYKNEVQPEQPSMRVKDTIRMSKNVLPQIKGVKQVSEKSEEIKIPNNKNEQNNFLFNKKKQTYMQAPTENKNSIYDLQKITEEPVKIIKNLQEAKKFDPEITKYTQLKAKYIETRTVSPQIIRIPSPLRFRRKQEVVKHLVATHIVERQSASIQF